MSELSIGIIGGSGLYDIEGVDIIETREVQTPFGKPSAPITIGQLGDRKVAFLPRHGINHEHSPSNLPYRANIWAMKQLGVFWLVAVNAVGSLQEEIEPGQFVVPDQIIDKTTKRPNTLYDDFVAHVVLGHPFDPILRQALLQAIREEEITVHDGGTYVCMEGPAFSTKAESLLHRQWGASLIGMTAMPEARLAREAEMSYASICLPTDYDVWREHDEVDINSILAILRQNISNVKQVIKRMIPLIPLGQEAQSEAYNAMQYAVMTKPQAIPAQAKEDFGLILNKYLS